MSETSPEPLPIPASILLVDDQPTNLFALEAVIERLGHRIVTAGSGEEALARVREEDFAVVLLDILMPGVGGLDTADLLRAEKRGGTKLPIIFLTAGDTPAAEAYAHGAVDVLRKPLEAEVVRAKVAVFVELFRAREQILRQAAALEALERTAAAHNVVLLNTSLDAIIGMDHRGEITEFNSAAEAMFGHRRDQVIGRALAEVIIPVHLREAHRRGLARYLSTGDSRVLDRRVEITALRADASAFPIELAIRRVGSFEPATFIGYVRDLTEHKRAEATRTFLARASEALASSLDYELTLRTVVHLAVPQVADWCAVDIVGEEGGSVRLAIAHVDPANVALAEELRLRYPPDPHAQQGLREEGMRSAMIVPMAASGRTFGAITFIAAESGRRYDSSDLTTAEDLARRAAIAIDNSQRYRAAQIAESRNRFLADATAALGSSLDYAETLERVARLAVPTIADTAGVYRVEADGSIRLTALEAADPAHAALGRELDELLPLRVDQQDRLLPRVVRTARAELLAEVPAAVHDAWSPTTRAAEIVHQLAIRSYMAIPLKVRGQVIGALALTTTFPSRRLGSDDLALAEELARRAGLAIENAQLYREAQEANRLKDDFLATVSHELRTPLTAILGWVHLLRSGQSTQVARAIETIERNARALAQIVEDILDVSRIITGKLRLEVERIELADVVLAAVDAMRPAAEAKQIALVVALDPAAGETTGDAARLQQVAWNLLSNAIKFTPKGGRVEVRLEREASSFHLRVIDTGCGIRPDFLPHVFERFRQGDSAPTRVHGGLGLGLAIVRHLVELHGGQVTAHSAGEGCGAELVVSLPIRVVAPDGLVSEQRARARESKPAASRRVLHAVRVLVVDDEADARDLIVALLEHHGAEVTTAASARAALEALEQGLPDVLVSDLGMPGEDGYGLMRQVRALGVERGFWLPAIALTGYAHAQDRNRALAAGYQVHLAKPIDTVALVTTIVELSRSSPPATGDDRG